MYLIDALGGALWTGGGTACASSACLVGGSFHFLSQASLAASWRLCCSSGRGGLGHRMTRLLKQGMLVGQRQQKSIKKLGERQP